MKNLFKNFKMHLMNPVFEELCNITFEHNCPVCFWELKYSSKNTDNIKCENCGKHFQTLTFLHEIEED